MWIEDDLGAWYQEIEFFDVSISWRGTLECVSVRVYYVCKWAYQSLCQERELEKQMKVRVSLSNTFLPLLQDTLLIHKFSLSL